MMYNWKHVKFLRIVLRQELKNKPLNDYNIEKYARDIWETENVGVREVKKMYRNDLIDYRDIGSVSHVTLTDAGFELLLDEKRSDDDIVDYVQGLKQNHEQGDEQ